MKSCPACLSTYPSHIGFCPSDGNALVESQEWTEGIVVRGKYRILSRVGQGGMGSVYKAIHLGFQELRALKVLNRELMSDPRFPRRFKQEAFTARKLLHPNVVRVEDIDESDDGHPFIAMEFIAGENLGHLIEKAGALPLTRTCSIVKQVASALHYAHQMGVIHRDIKPHNVALVGRDQSLNGSPAGHSLGQKNGQKNGAEVKVLDFGIAKLKEACAEGSSKPGTLTQTGLIVGTPQYMSPEQAKGKRGDDLDGRSDIYSLGVVMYQMLTGALPFEATTTVEMLVAHLQEIPRPPQVIRPDLQIPDPIAEIVMKCLEKNRELRPATGRALIDAIESAEEAIAGKQSVNLSTSHPLAPVQPPTPTPVLVAPEAEAAIQPAAPLTEPPALIPPQPLTPNPVLVAAESVAPLSDPPQTPALPTPAATNAAAFREPAKPAKLFLPLQWVRWATTFVGVVLLVTICLLLVRHRSGAQPPPRQAEAQPSPTLQNVAEPSVPAPVPTPADDSAAASAVQDDAQVVAEPTPNAQEDNQPAARIKPSSSRTARISSLGETPVAKQVRGAITEGDLHYENGEYDNAIQAYIEGLRLAPHNKELHRKIKRAQTAKAAEENAN